MVLDNHTGELQYLLRHLDSFIEQEAYQVLNDSNKDPQHSAVTLFNLIKCLLIVQQELGIQMEYRNVDEYLHFQCFTDAEIQVLKSKRIDESKYYVGKQY